MPRDSYGKFFNGDSYIVYSSMPYGETGGMDTKVRATQFLEVYYGLQDHDWQTLAEIITSNL